MGEQFDISDALLRLTDATAGQVPAEFEDAEARGKLKKHGLEQLARVRASLKSVQEIDDIKREIASLLDVQTLGALAMAWRLAEGEIEKALLDMRTDDKRLGAHLTKLGSAIKREAKKQEYAEQQMLQNRTHKRRERDLRKMFDNAIIPEGLKVPAGWDIDHDGVHTVRITPDGEEIKKRIANAPMLVAGRAKDVHQGDIQLKLAWRSGKIWVSRTIDRSAAMDSRALVKLASADAPVHTGNSQALVQFIADFESANAAVIGTSEEQTTRHMGWQRNNPAFGIVHGADHHRPVGEQPYIEFRPPAGFESFASGWCKGGTWDKWLLAIEPALLLWPLTMAGIYASAASPLLQILGIPPFVFEWCAKTSTGKSTALRGAASVWGRPRDILANWQQTPVFRERLAGVCHSLPVFIDETKLANRHEIAPVLYQFAGGQGKGRGSIEGVRDTASWQNIMLTTGEGPITGYTKDDGTRARVVSLFGPPMLSTGLREETQFVQSFDEGCHANYGHLGERLCRVLTRSLSAHEGLRMSFNELVDKYQKGQGNVARRLARPLAAIHLASDLVHDQCDVPRPKHNPMDALVRGVETNAADADQAVQAADDVSAWIGSNRHAFLGTGEKHGPPGGWLGVCAKERDYVAIRSDVLKEYLTKRDYDVNAIMRQWAESGRIRTDKGSVARTTQFTLPDGNIWRQRAVHFVPPVYKSVSEEAPSPY